MIFYLTQGQKVESVKIVMSINNLYGKCKFQKKSLFLDDQTDDLREGELEQLTDYQAKNLVYKLHHIKMKILEMRFIKEKVNTVKVN